MEVELQLERRQSLDNYDSPWKEILEQYFKPFLTLCCLEIANAIDWQKNHVFLEQELQSIVKKSELGKRLVDKLVKVWLLDGSETWILLHFEIQSNKQTNFAERMYIYNYRLFDKFHKPIVSVAILIDNDKNWRPCSYRREIFGCESNFNFISIKILDYLARKQELFESSNPFAIVILAHLDTLSSKNDPLQRYNSKLNLSLSLYRRGWTKNEIINLYKFIDWLMVLPEELEIQYLNNIESFEQENAMPYITFAERYGEKKGLEKGLLLGRQEGRQEGREEGREEGIFVGEQLILIHLLTEKFGYLAKNYRNQINNAAEAELKQLASKVLFANKIEDVFA